MNPRSQRRVQRRSSENTRQNALEQLPRHGRHAREQYSAKDAARLLPKPFGIRRLLDPAVSRVILSAIEPLAMADGLSGNAKLRPRIHTTLLPQMAYRDRVRAGRLKGQSLVVVKGQMERRTRGRNQREVDADIVGINLHKGKTLNLELASQSLDQDSDDIETVLGWFGVKGLKREGLIGQLHASLIDLERPLSLCEQKNLQAAAHYAIDCALSETDILSDEPPMIFGGWQVYPDPELALAA